MRTVLFSGGLYWSRGCVPHPFHHTPPFHPHPTPRGQTNTCENITLPQTSGSNNPVTHENEEIGLSRDVTSGSSSGVPLHQTLISLHDDHQIVTCFCFTNLSGYGLSLFHSLIEALNRGLNF